VLILRCYLLLSCTALVTRLLFALLRPFLRKDLINPWLLLPPRLLFNCHHYIFLLCLLFRLLFGLFRCSWLPNLLGLSSFAGGLLSVLGCWVYQSSPASSFWGLSLRLPSLFGLRLGLVLLSFSTLLLCYGAFFWLL
jgi:hypothetical protein